MEADESRMSEHLLVGHPATPQAHRVARKSDSRWGDRRRAKGSIMLGKPFGRRSLLRGAGGLTAAALAPWAAGCASDDDENALTFFFAANPDEADARMRVVDEFRRRHPDIKVRPVLSGPGVMQQLSTFAPAANVLMCSWPGT